MPDRELPLDRPVEWSPVARPGRESLRGSRVTLRPVGPDDAEDLYAVSHPPEGDPTIWTYLSFDQTGAGDVHPSSRKGSSEWIRS